MNDWDKGLGSRRAGWLAGLVAAMVVAGCGGGDGGSTDTKGPQTKTLSGSQGHPERYLGTWASGCGQVLFGGGSVKSVHNTWRFTAVSGSTVTGTFEQRQYGDSNCKTSAVSTLSASATLAIQSQATLTPGPGTSSVVFAGTADQVQVTLRQAGAPASTSVQHAAFEGETKLRFTQSLPFSTIDLEYDKR